MISRRNGSPAREPRTERMASHSKKPVRREGAGEDHHPGQQEDDVEVDGRERLVLVEDAERDQHRPPSSATSVRSKRSDAISA